MTCGKYNAYKLILSVNIAEYQLHATLKNFMIHLSVNQDIFSKKLKLIWIKDVVHRQALPYHEWLITGVLMISLILLPKQSRLKLNSGINLSILISCVNSGFRFSFTSLHVQPVHIMLLSTWWLSLETIEASLIIKLPYSWIISSLKYWAEIFYKLVCGSIFVVIFCTCMRIGILVANTTFRMACLCSIQLS